MPFKVYVGNLSFELDTPDITEAFRRFGPIEHLSLKKGFAFVNYENLEDAKTAVKEMHEVELSGRRIKCEIASSHSFAAGHTDRMDDNRRSGFGGRGGSGRPTSTYDTPPSASIFVGNIPPHLKLREVETFFQKYGKVVNVKILPQARGNPAISAFVDYADVTDARRAHGQPMEIDGYKLRTDFKMRHADAFGGAGGGRYATSRAPPPPSRRERSRSPFERRRERSRSPVARRHERERSRSPVARRHERERSRSPVARRHERERSRSPVARRSEREHSKERRASGDAADRYASRRDSRDLRSPPRTSGDREHRRDDARSSHRSP